MIGLGLWDLVEQERVKPNRAAQPGQVRASPRRRDLLSPACSTPGRALGTSMEAPVRGGTEFWGTHMRQNVITALPACGASPQCCPQRGPGCEGDPGVPRRAESCCQTPGKGHHQLCYTAGAAGPPQARSLSAPMGDVGHIHRANSWDLS